MSILGGAWTPNVVWYLRAGPRRFSELRVDVPKISAKVLTMRLRDLERKGVVARGETDLAAFGRIFAHGGWDSRWCRPSTRSSMSGIG